MFNYFDIKLCECGECDEVIPLRAENGSERHYKRYHGKKGKKHWNWKGGFYYKGKYKMIWQPSHPNSDQDGYMMEHRLNMEQHIGRYLDSKEKVHHIDENPYNNSIYNLEILSQSQHFSLHLKKDMSGRICLECKSTKTFINKNGWACWTKYQDGFICRNCDNRHRYWINKSIQ